MHIDASVAGGLYRHHIAFTATGGGYCRIWAMNLLLLVTTLGFYFPWARARRLEYFAAQTRIGGHSLAYRSSAADAWPSLALLFTGMAAAGLVFLRLKFGMNPLPALAACAALVPALLHAKWRRDAACMQWQGLRFAFVGRLGSTYGHLVPTLALVAVMTLVYNTWLARAWFSDSPEGVVFQLMAIAVVWMLLLVAGAPFCIRPLHRHVHGHHAWGGLRLPSTLGTGALCVLFAKAAGLLAACSALALALAVWMKSAWVLGCCVPLAAIVIRQYLTVRLQNLLWSSLGRTDLRFESRLRLGRYLGVEWLNCLLLLLTLGLYWPFAVVRTRRARWEAVTLRAHRPLADVLRPAAVPA